VLVAIYTSQFVEHLNIVDYIDSFLFGQEVNQFAPLSIPENSSINFSSQGHDSGLLWRCNMMPLQAVILF
jgi:hypothetical protein